MTIKDIKKDLEGSKLPVIKSLHHGSGFKLLILGFKKGMVLQEHKAHMRSKLTVLEGDVKYLEHNREVELKQYDEIEIPLEVLHTVEAKEDSLCILSQGE